MAPAVATSGVCARIKCARRDSLAVRQEPDDDAKSIAHSGLTEEKQ